MGYAGYVPAKLPPSQLSPLEAALRQIYSLESLEILGKLVRNVVTQPQEDKYRRIRLSNPKINATVVAVEGGLDSLTAMGWVRDEGDPETLVVAKGKLSMKEVRAIEDAKDRLKKEARSAVSRSSSRSSLTSLSSGAGGGDGAKEALRAQLEADRRERAAREPVTQGSKAQALPGSGPNVATAKQLGIQGNQGCC